MSSISISWDRRAVKELRSLQRKDRSRVFKAVVKLSEDPLRGAPLTAEWKGLRFLSVADTPVIYTFDGRELLVSVIRIAHRRGVYR